MGRKKKFFEKPCITCGKMFEPGKHKGKLNCSKECLKKHQENNKTSRLEKAKNAMKEKYGVDHPSKIEGFYEKVKETKKEKYGNENYNNRNKAKNTIKKIYGVENIMQSESVKLKSKQTKKKKFGNENYNNRKKAKKTSLKKYGEEHHMKTISSIQKMENTNIERYGTSCTLNTKKAVDNLKKHNKRKHGCNWYFESEEHKSKIKKYKITNLDKLLKKYEIDFNIDKYSKIRIKNKNGSIEYIKYDVKCKKCKTTFKTRLVDGAPICRKCYPINSNSTLNKEFKEFLISLNVLFIENDREIIKPLEIDFLIPDKNIAFELNGNYFHSEIGGGKDKKYHINKTFMCNKVGVKLIHIFEDEWINKKDIVKSRIKNMLGLIHNKIYARSCSIKEVSNKEKSLFLESNHIQGNSVDSKRYGLFYNNELVSIMTFSKKRAATGHFANNENVTTDWELNRFCSKPNFIIIGSFNKLLSNFIKLHKDYKTIITYADCRWSGINEKNTVYFKSGFQFIHKTPCSYYYVNKKNYYIRKHRFSMTKHKLLEMYNASKEKTEWEIAIENGFDRIWDCGSMKFEIKNPN